MVNRSRNIQPRHSNPEPHPDTPIGLSVPPGVGIQTLANITILWDWVEAVNMAVWTAYSISQTPTDSCLLDDLTKSIVVVLGKKLLSVRHMLNKNPGICVVVVKRMWH